MTLRLLSPVTGVVRRIPKIPIKNAGVAIVHMNWKFRCLLTAKSKGVKELMSAECSYCQRPTRAVAIWLGSFARRQPQRTGTSLLVEGLITSIRDGHHRRFAADGLKVWSILF